MDKPVEQEIAEEAYEAVDDLLDNMGPAGIALSERERIRVALLIIASTLDLTASTRNHTLTCCCLDLAVSEEHIRGYFHKL